MSTIIQMFLTASPSFFRPF